MKINNSLTIKGRMRRYIKIYTGKKTSNGGWKVAAQPSKKAPLNTACLPS
jgi:hypothetical protein